ncbi:MAG: bifunctional 2-methylcitrate dehydratase/aconitate hydratase [Chlamydiia bacterium]|nr:bifunctional 2-methylcitrate dehydratase/aconitate hydratase [Chlamydiia bacterium]
MPSPAAATKRDIDDALHLIADYVVNGMIDSEEAYQTARAALADSLGCAILALQFPECTKLLGPVVPGTVVPRGCRVPGTDFCVDPICAAFNIGTMIRWLDYNDTWLAAEWGHPSDNLGGVIAVADYLDRHEDKSITVKELLTWMIKAYEIQGGLAMLNSFNRIGFDHVIFVKAATTAVATAMLGGTYDQVVDALSNAWIDCGPLRTYRHAPCTGSRKSWAAGDATARGVQLALMTMRGEMGYPRALTAERWGLYDVLFDGKPFVFQQPLGSYVMENVLFKISFPAEFHAQTAVECAITLHESCKGRFDEIEKIEIDTHESALRIIDKTGLLKNPADRDHCLQYMVAIALLHGGLTADDYADEAAADPRIDRLRSKMILNENVQFSKDYMDPSKRSIANAMTITFADGKKSDRVVVEYPIGHRRRRSQGLPLLFDKLDSNLRTHYPDPKVREIVALFQDYQKLKVMPISKMVELFSSR